MPTIVLKKKKKIKSVWSYLFSLIKEPQLNWLRQSFGKRTTTQDRSRKNSKYRSKVVMDSILNCIFREMSFFFCPLKSEQSQKNKIKIKIYLIFFAIILKLKQRTKKSSKGKRRVGTKKKKKCRPGEFVFFFFFALNLIPVRNNISAKIHWNSRNNPVHSSI